MSKPFQHFSSHRAPTSPLNPGTGLAGQVMNLMGQQNEITMAMMTMVNEAHHGQRASTSEGKWQRCQWSASQDSHWNTSKDVQWIKGQWGPPGDDEWDEWDGRGRVRPGGDHKWIVDEDAQLSRPGDRHTWDEYQNDTRRRRSSSQHHRDRADTRRTSSSAARHPALQASTDPPSANRSRGAKDDSHYRGNLDREADPNHEPCVPERGRTVRRRVKRRRDREVAATVTGSASSKAMLRPRGRARLMPREDREQTRACDDSSVTEHSGSEQAWPPSPTY